MFQDARRYLPTNLAAANLDSARAFAERGRARLEEGKVFPLRNQVDVAMKAHDWRGGRYGAHPECSLLASPRSEDGACDTDVQTLGKADVLAPTSLMDGMYTI